MSKKNANYRIDEKLLEQFDEASKITGIKKTFVVENAIKEFVKKVNNEAKSNR